jgi:hypothetical protein
MLLSQLIIIEMGKWGFTYLKNNVIHKQDIYLEPDVGCLISLGVKETSTARTGLMTWQLLIT